MLVAQEIKDQQVLLDTLVQQAPLALLACKVAQVLLDLQELAVLQVLQALLDIQVLLVPKAQQPGLRLLARELF